MTIELDSFLEHYGVKGMKWGVRRANKKFEKKALTPSTYFKVYNAMADRMNSTEIDRINNMPQFRNRDMNDMNDPVTKAYHKEYADTTTRILNEISTSVIGSNASGTRKVVFDYDPANDAMPSAKIVDVDATHEDSVDRTLDIEWDENGYILSINFTEPLVQTNLNVSDFLEHFGVKGMKWGVRRTAKQLRSAKSRPEEKAKRLSDDELKTQVARLRLEKDFAQLSRSLEPSANVKGLLAKHGGQAASIAVGTATSAVVGLALKKAFKNSGSSSSKPFKKLKDNVSFT